MNIRRKQNFSLFMREIEKAPCSVLNPFDHYQFQFCWQLGQLCSIVHSGMTSYCTFLTFFYHFHFSLVDFDPVPDSNSDFRLALQKIASICLHLSSSTNFSVFTRHHIYATAEKGTFSQFSQIQIPSIPKMFQVSAKGISCPFSSSLTRAFWIPSA